MPRVLWLIKGLAPGGAERLLEQLALVVDRSRFDIECAFVTPDRDHLRPELEAAGIRCTCIGPGPLWPWRLLQLMRTGQYGIVHSHSPALASLARLLCASRMIRSHPRHVTTEHGPWAERRATTQIVNAATSPLDAACIAVSPEVLQSMKGPIRGRTTLSVQGVDLEALDSLRLETRRPEKATRLSLVTVANLEPQKDHSTLLHACKLLHEEHGVAFHLDLIGGGTRSQRDALDDLINSLGLSALVTCHGFTTNARSMMATCDMLIISSLWESGPVVAMEAAALGIPIVSTEVGILRDYFTAGMDYVAVPLRSSDRLAEEIAALARDPHRRQALARRALVTSEQFDSRRAAADLEAVYVFALNR